MSGPGRREAGRRAQARHATRGARLSPLAIYQAVSFVLLGAMALIGATNLAALKRRRRAPASLPTPAPRVSVLVPARNEERTIGACVRSLATQDYPAEAYEVLVLDDRSTDATAAQVEAVAAQHAQVRLLRGAALSAGWGGKAHACQQLADGASGDWLLFVDADTVHAPAMLRTVVAAALAHGAAAVTALPREYTGTVGERLLVPHLFFFLLSLQPLPLLERAGDARFVFANGQFFLVARDLYRRTGGHAAVRTQLMEDLALAVRWKRAGARVLVLLGDEWVTCRMYVGFIATWRGFVRSLQAGHRLAPSYLLSISAMAILFHAGPFVVLAGLLLAGAEGRLVRLATGQVVALLTIRVVVGRGLRQTAAEIALFPAGAFVLSAAALTTLWRSLRRQPITWRGRAYGDL